MVDGGGSRVEGKAFRMKGLRMAGLRAEDERFRMEAYGWKVKG